MTQQFEIQPHHYRDPATGEPKTNAQLVNHNYKDSHPHHYVWTGSQEKCEQILEELKTPKGRKTWLLG